MIQLRDYQDDAVRLTIDFLFQKAKNPIIALPTGTGKSVVIAELIGRLAHLYQGARFLVLTHSKQLVRQNWDEFRGMYPYFDSGAFCAGLGKRQPERAIVFGTIGTVKRSLDNDPHEIGVRALLIIDECHMLSPEDETMYQQAITALKKLNPSLLVVGLTATAYRMKSGSLIDEGSIFNEISFDRTRPNDFIDFIEKGYLAPLRTKAMKTTFDLEGVKTVGGEFNLKDLEQAVDVDEVTKAACQEMILYGADREKWLVFASGVDHAEHIAGYLNCYGVPTGVVHSKLSEKVNDEQIRMFQEGEIKALVNMGKLTTGFNVKAIDLIGILRPTKSPGLHVQILGRGTRPAPGKRDCLVLDFARNIERLGPINDPVVKDKRKKGDTAGMPVKICPNCGSYLTIATTVCDDCGFVFPVSGPSIEEKASELEAIRGFDPVFEWKTVINVGYHQHFKRNDPLAPSTLCVRYTTTYGETFQEFVCLSHPAPARHGAVRWWRARSGDNGPVPEEIPLALSLCEKLKTPKRINVQVNSKYKDIIDYEF